MTGQWDVSATVCVCACVGVCVCVCVCLGEKRVPKIVDHCLLVLFDQQVLQVTKAPESNIEKPLIYDRDHMYVLLKLL